MDLTKLLSKCVDNPRVLVQATNYLSNYWDVPDYYRMLVDVVLDAEQRMNIRLFASIVLKNHIRDFWREKVTKSEKKTVRQKLIQALRISNSQIKTSIAMALAEVIQADFPHQWSTCFEEIGTYLNATDLGVIDAGLQALQIIFAEPGPHLVSAVPKMLPTLLNIFSNEYLPSQYQEKCLVLVQSCLETVSWADGLQPEIVSTALDGCFLIWVKLLIKVLEEPLVSPERYNIIRLALKVLTTFFRDLANYSKVSLGLIVKLSWKLIYNYIPAYLGGAVLNSEPQVKHEDEEEDLHGVTGLVSQLIELLSCLIMRPTVSQAIVTEISPIVCGLCVYIFLTKENERMISLDAFDDEEDEVEMSSVRISTYKLMRDLIEMVGEGTVEAVVQVADKLLLNPGNEILFTHEEEMADYIASVNSEVQALVQTYPEIYTWKSRETAQYLLGKMSEDIMVFHHHQPLDAFVQSVFSSVVSHDLQGGMPNTLKSRSLWLVSKLSPIIEGEVDVEQLWVTCGQCLGPEYPIGTRLTACLPVQKLAKKVDPAVIAPAVEGVYQSLTDMLETAEPEYIRVIIETAVDITGLSAEVTSRAPDLLADKVFHLYRAYHSQSGVSNIIQTLLRLWCDIPACIAPLAQIFVPYFMHVLAKYQAVAKGKLPGSTNSSSTIDSRSQIDVKNDYYMILPGCMDILCLLLKKCQIDGAEGVALMEVLTPILDLMARSDDLQLIQYGTGCLRTYVSIAHAQINAQGLTDRVIEICMKCLDPTIPEIAASHLGYFVVQLFAKLSPKIDQDILVGLIQKLHKCKLPSIVQGIVLVFARLILVNTHEIITFLGNLTVENRVALKVLLDKWLIHQPLIRGRYTKNASFCALGKLYSLQDQQIESLLVVGFNPSHSAACLEVSASLKMLSILIRCLDNESVPIQKRKVAFEEDNPQTVVASGGLGIGGAFDYEEEEVMDTVESESDDDREMILHDGPDDPLDGVGDDLIVEEEFEYMDINVRGEREKTTLKDYETGSECYLSDMLDFEYDNEEDVGDEISEEDLKALGDDYHNIDLQSYLLEFIQKFLDNDRGYILNCIRQLPREDQALFKKHFTL